MATRFDQISNRAKELLTDALAVDGPVKGMLSLSPAMGGGERLVIGNHYQMLYGDDIAATQMAFYELADLRLIDQIATGGYMVTPLGCHLEIVFNGSKPYPRAIEETSPKVEHTIEDIPNQQASKEVFVVHGRDVGVRDSVVRFLSDLQLKPIVLQERPSKGRTIAEKFEEHAREAGFAVVLFTPDDEGALVGEYSNPQLRARQNVIFELGFFIGRLGRDKVSVLYKGDVEIPSDYAGVEYIPFDYEGGWKLKLITELQTAGFDVDANQATRR